MEIEEVFVVDFDYLGIVLVVLVFLVLVKVADDYLSVFVDRYGLFFATCHPQPPHFLEVLGCQLDEHVFLAADWAA